MNLANINQVVKASPAIQIQGKMTHLQRRAWNVLLANAYNELPDRDIHSVSVAELSTKVAIDEAIADHFCKDTLAPINDAYEHEKARILAETP